MANLSNALVGSGLLALPAAFVSSGLVAGLLSLCVLAAGSAYAAGLVVRTKRLVERHAARDDVARYDEVGAHAAGAAGRAVANVALVASQLGFASSYFVFVARDVLDIASGSASPPPPPPPPLAPPPLLLPAQLAARLTVQGAVAAPAGVASFPPAYVILVLFPLAWLVQLVRRLDKLSFVSVISGAAVLFAAVALLVDGARRLQETGGALHWPWDTAVYGPMFKAATYADFFGIACFSYACQGVVLPLAASLAPPPTVKTTPLGEDEEGGEALFECFGLLGGAPGGAGAGRRSSKPSDRPFYAVVIATMVLTTVLYGVVGMLGAMMYGDGVQAMVTEELRDDALGLSVKVALAVMCFCSLPVQLFPVVQLAEDVAVARGLVPASGATWGGVWARNLVRALVVLVPVAVALLLPCFGQVTSLVGALCNSSMMFLLPPFFFGRVALRFGTLSVLDGVLCAVTVLVGLAGAGTCTAAVVAQLADGQCA